MVKLVLGLLAFLALAFAFYLVFFASDAEQQRPIQVIEEPAEPEVARPPVAQPQRAADAARAGTPAATHPAAQPAPAAAPLPPPRAMPAPAVPEAPAPAPAMPPAPAAAAAIDRCAPVLRTIEQELAPSPPNLALARRSLRLALEVSDACFNSAEQLIERAERRAEAERVQAQCRNTLQAAENQLRNNQYLAAIETGKLARIQGCAGAEAFVRRAEQAYDEARRVGGPVWN